MNTNITQLLTASIIRERHAEAVRARLAARTVRRTASRPVAVFQALGRAARDVASSLRDDAGQQARPVLRDYPYPTR